MSGAEQTGLSPVKQALLEIRRLKEALARERQRQHEPIAVVGVGVRFPGGVDSPDAYWELLRDGVDAVGPIPDDRWEHERYFDPTRERQDSYYVRHGGFIDGPDQFDPEFFGIAPIEAEAMDPQQRVLLETAWEALEHAGIPAGGLHGSRTGVWVGIGTSDYHRLVMEHGERVDAYASSGTSFSVAAGRISYLLGLQGPAMAIDTACSSSLVAVHLACQSLRGGESDLALAGGVNLMLAPETTVDFCSAGMLSPDGHCRTFDAAADGYVRSEGCGVVVLKRLSDAERDGDRILAVVRGSAVNQDGRSSGLTAPNGPAQEAVLRAALADAGLQPGEVEYVEAHGTGTSLGDPIEVQALGAVFGSSEARPRPLWIGSAKTNLGHLEAAAGMAGLIKAVEAVRRGEIPPHLHYTEPNPHIRWSDYSLAVPTRRTPFAAGETRRAGVSSFGFSGTNAHVIVEEPPVAASVESDAASPESFTLTLSAPHDTGLRELATRYVDHLGASADSFADICATANAGRTAFSKRLALVARDAGQARRLLGDWLDGGSPPGLWIGSVQPVEVAFCFGEPDPDDAPAKWLARWPAAAAALSDGEAIRNEVIDEVTGDMGGEVEDRAEKALDRAIQQHARAALYRSWGILPAVVVGGGAGRYLAAHHVGILTLRDALRLTVAHAVHEGRGGEGPFAQLLRATQFMNGDGVSFVEAGAGRVVRGSELATLWLNGATNAGGVDISVVTGVPGMAGAALRFVPVGTVDRLVTGLREQDGWIESGADEEEALGVLAASFVAGLAPSWSAFTGGRRRVALPTYPFQRRRFWFPERRGGTEAVRGVSIEVPAAGEDAGWSAAVAAGLERAELAPLGTHLADYGEVWEALEALSEGIGQNTLISLGGLSDDTGYASVDDVLAAAGIDRLYAQIVSRWLGAMARNGVIERAGEGYRAGTLAPVELEPRWSLVRRKLAGDPAMLRYLEHAAPLVPEVMGGRVSALETLFPDGSFEMAANLYENSAVLRYVNGIAATALRAFVAARGPGRPIRVIEVGAGTGGTTSSLVPVLPPERSRYTYTDVSEFFMDFGREKFAASPIVETAILDLEQDPAAQGFTPGAYDVVVGSNVIHAARDIREALRRVRSLLAPHGLLLLVESTGHHAWHDISTGLIEGWQHFTDDLRAETPLLGPERWLSLLEETGFAHAAALPGEGSAASVLRQHVIMADAGAGATLASGSATQGAATTERPASVVEPLPAGEAAPRPARVTEAVPSANATPAAPLSEEASEFQQRLRSAIGTEREEVAVGAVRDCVMEVLRSDPDRPPARDARLMDLGLDSLMAVRLRNRLQKKLGLARKLPATLVFDYPTIRQIAALVTSNLVGESPTAAPRQDAAPPDDAGAAREAEVAAMSDAEVEAMLERLQTEGMQ